MIIKAVTELNCDNWVVLVYGCNVRVNKHVNTRLYQWQQIRVACLQCPLQIVRLLRPLELELISAMQIDWDALAQDLIQGAWQSS